MQNNPSDIDRFKKAGYAAEKANKSIDEGLSEVRRRLKPDGNPSVADSLGTGSSGVTIRPPRVTRPIFGSGGGRTKPDPDVTASSSYYEDEEENTETQDASGSGDAHEREGGCGQVGLLVAGNCEHLIQEFLSYKSEEVGTSAATDHCLDSLRYACMGVTGSDNGGIITAIPSTW